MKRRQFLHAGAAIALMSQAGARALDNANAPRPSMDAAAFHAARRFADLACGKIAYIDAGHGEAALFLHGAPLNGYQWRGAIDRLSPLRRCIAPDFMGLGYSEVPAGQ